jgi:hypothetical protein
MTLVSRKAETTPIAPNLMAQMTDMNNVVKLVTQAMAIIMSVIDHKRSLPPRSTAFQFA